MPRLNPNHNHDAFCAVMGCGRGAPRPNDDDLWDDCASVTISLRLDRKTKTYFATVDHTRGGLETLTKEGATPGEAATLVWGAAIEQLRRKVDQL